MNISKHHVVVKILQPNAGVEVEGSVSGSVMVVGAYICLHCYKVEAEEIIHNS